MTIDIDALREALRDYYGTAVASGLLPAMQGLAEVDAASPEELVRIAQREGFDLRKYEA